jgi:hypothetical protein
MDTSLKIALRAAVRCVFAVFGARMAKTAADRPRPIDDRGSKAV